MNFIRFLPNSERFVSFNRDGSVGLWDALKMEETETITAWGNNNLGVAVSPNGKVLASGDSHGNLRFWDVKTSHELTNFNFQSVPSWPAKFVSDGEILLVFDANSMVHSLATDSWKQISQWRMPDGISAMGIRTDEQLMAVGYRNGIVKMLRVNDGHEVATIPAHSRWVTGANFTPDGKYLATSSEDGLVRLWDPVGLVELATLKGHLLGVHSVVASPDGLRLATGSNAKEAIKLWDLATRQELLNLEGAGLQFDRTQFSPDGNLLISVNSEGALHYWRAPSMASVEMAEPKEAR